MLFARDLQRDVRVGSERHRLGFAGNSIIISPIHSACRRHQQMQPFAVREFERLLTPLWLDAAQLGVRERVVEFHTASDKRRSPSASRKYPQNAFASERRYPQNTHKLRVVSRVVACRLGLCERQKNAGRACDTATIEGAGESKREQEVETSTATGSPGWIRT